MVANGGVEGQDNQQYRDHKIKAYSCLGCLGLAVLSVVAIALLSALGDKPSGQSSTGRSPRAGSTARVMSQTVCAPNKEALDAVTKWAGVDKEEFVRAMLETGSTVLSPGDSVKILDPGIIRTQIRTSGGRACWVAAEHVR